MYCDKCLLSENVRLRFVNGQGFFCSQCHLKIRDEVSFEKNRVFSIVDTINLRFYYKNRGNVSLARINEIKSRCLHPDGNGEVVTKNKFGKITDRIAVNY